jgi:hypothetical protein
VTSVSAGEATAAQAQQTLTQKANKALRANKVTLEGPMSVILADAVARETFDLLEVFLEKLELAHCKCDLDDDADCYAEQYGDGDADEHAKVGLVKSLLAQIEGAIWRSALSLRSSGTESQG